MEESLLFRSFENSDLDFDSVKYPATRFIGYGPNQIAFKEMAEGYFWGAAFLCKSQFSQGQESQENSLYPVVFLYRHSIELILKASILNLYIPIDRPQTKGEKQALKKIISGHNLLCLLENISKSSGVDSGCTDIIKRLQPYINEFMKFDSNSTDFRYAINLDYRATNSQEKVKGFDLKYTFEKMRALWDDLNDLYYATDTIWRDARKEKTKY